jgi:peptidoglycan/LPS O-acetylase OafA/YrhL
MKTAKKKIKERGLKESKNNIEVPKAELFSLKTGNSVKGLALLLLLWHHLFYQHPEYQQLVFYSAHIAKVCVAIFLILTGYGLTQSVQHDPVGLFTFYKKRFSHIYLNYWFIALIFVPLGVYFFNRPITDIFETAPYFKFIIQMLGYHLYFKEIGYGYNPTWWYISVLFGLYWLFPLMFIVLKRYGGWVLIPAIIILLIGPVAPFGLSILNLWIFPFMFGIYLALKNGFVRISSMLIKLGWLRYFVLTTLIGLLAVLKLLLLLGGGEFPSIRIDGFFGATIVLFMFELTQLSPVLESGLAFLGKHLFNIFLFHTFIFYFFFKDFIYSFKQPVLIFLVLLIICLIISFMLELIKKASGYQMLELAIDKIPIHDHYIIN